MAHPPPAQTFLGFGTATATATTALTTATVARTATTTPPPLSVNLSEEEFEEEFEEESEDVQGELPSGLVNPASHLQGELVPEEEDPVAQVHGQKRPCKGLLAEHSPLIEYSGFGCG